MSNVIMYGSVAVKVDGEFLTCPVYATDESSLKLYMDSMHADTLVQQKLLKAWDTYTGLANTKKEPPAHVDGDVWRRLDVSKLGRFSTNLQNVVFAAKIATPIRYMFERSVIVDESTGKALYLMGDSADSSTVDGKQCYMLTENASDANNLKPGEIYACYKTTYSTVEYVCLCTTEMRLILEKIDGIDEDTAYRYFQKLTFKNGKRGGNTLTKVRTGMAKYHKDYLGFDYEPVAQNYFVDDYLLYDNIDEVIAAHPQKNFRWIHNRKYEIVTPENFEEVLKEYYMYDGVIAIDTETTGLKITYRSREGKDDQLVGICLSKEPGTGHYFPLQMTKIQNLCDGDHKYFMERYMRKFLTVRRFVTHNLQFDWKVFYIYGINLNVVFDTLIAFYVTERTADASFEVGLKSLAARILGLDMFELDDFVKNGDWSKSGMHFSDLPFELCRRYAPTDADMTLSLYYYIKETRILERFDATYIADLEVKFAKAAAYSEFYGYPVNVENLPELDTTLRQQAQELYNEMKEIVGHDFNPRSTPQLVKIMYDELKIPPRNGERSTKKEILAELADMTDFNDKPLYPFVAILREYRKVSGIISNFLESKDTYINSDGIIHPSVNTLGARTGRVSIKDPNYQSYNDAVKKNIVPRKGFKMWDCDFSQIEYRTLASMAKEQFLIDAFEDPDTDYHTLQASRMFNVPYAAAVGEIRQQAKRVNFALPYGMEDESLGAAVYGKRCKENTIKAATLRELYFKGQDNVRHFFDVVRGDGVKNGYTTTLFGRKRFYRKGSASVNKIRRQAGNAVIQGTAADIYKIAVVRVFQMICSKGWLDKVLLDGFIHDEILGEVSEDINFDEFIACWRDAFEVPVEGFCKLFAGFGIGDSWYMAKKQDLHPLFIQELIDTAHTRVWDGDGDRYIRETVVQGFKNHKARRVVDYLRTVEQNVVINPVMSSLLEETTKDWLSVKVKTDRNGLKLEMETLLQREVTEAQLDAITKKDKKNKPCGIKSLQDWITVFCYWQGIDGSNIKLLTATEVSNDTNGTADTVISTEQSVADVAVEIEQMTDTEYMYSCLQAYGYYVDEQTMTLYIDYGCMSNAQAQFFVNNFCSVDGTFSVVLVVKPGTSEMQMANTTNKVTGRNVMHIQRFMTQIKANLLRQ